MFMLIIMLKTFCARYTIDGAMFSKKYGKKQKLGLEIGIFLNLC